MVNNKNPAKRFFLNKNQLSKFIEKTARYLSSLRLNNESKHALKLKYLRFFKGGREAKWDFFFMGTFSHNRFSTKTPDWILKPL